MSVRGGGSAGPCIAEAWTSRRSSRPAPDTQRQPCFTGSRIAVDDVLDYLAAGMTTEETIHDLPELDPDHVRAPLEFAAQRERRLAAPA